MRRYDDSYVNARPLGRKQRKEYREQIGIIIALGHEALRRANLDPDRYVCSVKAGDDGKADIKAIEVLETVGGNPVVFGEEIPLPCPCPFCS